MVVGEAGEERDRGLDHTLGPGDRARAAAEPGRPVPLPRVVALDPVGLLLADVEPALRDQLGVGRPIIGAVEADAPALRSFQQPLAGGLVTTAQLPGVTHEIRASVSAA